MSRVWLIPALAALATGCIIYEERYHRVPCDGCVDEGPIEDPPAPEPPEDPETQITSDVALTVAEAYPAETLLSTLVAVDPDVDLATVSSVTFERDVVILDSIQRPDEIVLLLEIDPEAAPGEVEVYITTATGGAWLLDEPFTILECPTGADCP